MCSRVKNENEQRKESNVTFYLFFFLAETFKRTMEHWLFDIDDRERLICSSFFLERNYVVQPEKQLALSGSKRGSVKIICYPSESATNLRRERFRVQVHVSPFTASRILLKYNWIGRLPYHSFLEDNVSPFWSVI